MVHMNKPAQHHLANTITVDGVSYKLPRGYVSGDGKTVMRDDGHRLVPRALITFEGKLAINEIMKAIPLKAVRS